MKQKANEFDRLAGQHMKMARVMADMSQEALGAKVGVSFQQIQKYERGANRMSIGRFLEICEIVGVDAADLVRRLQDPKSIKPKDQPMSLEAVKAARIVEDMPQEQRAPMIAILHGAERSFATHWPNGKHA